MKNDRDFLFPQHSLDLKQPSLFRMTPDEFTSHTRVSLDEMSRWKEKGWLAFDPYTIKDYDERERKEVLFIRALSRFGLSDAMIDRLLSGLEKPYCYNTTTTFFSFATESWITLPKEPDRAEMASECIEALIETKTWDLLTDLKERISKAIAEEEGEDN